MTIVIGALAPQGLLVTADSRGTHQFAHGKQTFYDDIQKVYCTPPLIFGMSGDARACQYFGRDLLKAWQDGKIKRHREPEILKYNLIGWITKYYNQSKSIIGENNKFSFIFAVYTPPRRPLETEIPTPKGASIREIFSSMSMPLEAASGFGFSLQFPEGLYTPLMPCSALLIGSGKDIDERLLHYRAMMVQDADKLARQIRSQSAHVLQYQTGKSIDDLITQVNQCVILYVSRKKNLSVNQCMHGFMIDRNGKVKASGCGLIGGNLPILTFLRNEMPIPLAPPPPFPHKLMTEALEKLATGRNDLEKVIESLLKDRIDIFFHEGSFYLLDHRNDRCCKFRSVIDIAFDTSGLLLY